MVDQIKRQAVTTHATSPVSVMGLAFGESEDCYLWSVQPNREHDLRALTQGVFGAAPQFGKMLCIDSLRLLHLWPHQVYLLHTQPALPASLDEYASILTDISHGFCELGLSGDRALEFVDSHCSADLMAAHIDETRNRRCLLGQYRIILWWDQPDDIRILVERSYAQSFCDYLDQLMQRWR